MALVVTIVVIIILASISISGVFGENGILKKVQEAKEMQSNSVITEEEEMNFLLAEYANMMATDSIPPTSINETEGTNTEDSGDTNSTGGTDTEEPTVPTGPNGKQLVSSVTTTDHETITGEDDKGNQVVIPGGFKLAEDSGTTVQEGIVIEDADGNQFVWIPVSNINGDGSNKIILDDGSEVEITLGRYTFATASPGTATIEQKGSNYASAVTIETYHQELSSFRESDGSTINATAKDLAGFVSSVETNKGYYLARYEASYASGSSFGVGEDSTYYRPASKASTVYRTSSTTSLSSGMLWNLITQGDASMVCRQMYYGNSYVESDLCNSYAWDTAIVYIQKMGNSNYANKTPTTSSIANTGSSTNNDQKCKIYDMSGNLGEWTTEYGTTVDAYNNYYPYSTRSGDYINNGYSPSHRSSVKNSSAGNRSFRPLLYCKTGS